MKNKVLMIIMVAGTLFLTGCHSNKNNISSNDLVLKKTITKEELIGCYEKNGAFIYNDEKVLDNSYFESTLKIDDAFVEVCFKETNECVKMNYIYNNSRISLNSDSTVFAKYYDVIYFDTNDAKYNLILKSKIDDYMRTYSYFKKVECANED